MLLLVDGSHLQRVAFAVHFPSREHLGNHPFQQPDTGPHMIRTDHHGVFAATLTPFRADGTVAIEQVPALVEYYLDQKLDGLYVNGSTGEGPSLTTEERRQLAEAFVAAGRGKMTIVIQVGHNSVVTARELAAHAESIGADAISAKPPSYFRIDSPSTLVESSAYVAAGAPKTPFYYYHIPQLTGAVFPMGEYLALAESQIPNLAGMKFTSQELDEFQVCLDWQQGQGTFFWGVDEALLSAVAVGARGAIGSTYNVAGGVFRGVMDAFYRGDVDQARRLQLQGIRIVRTLIARPFAAALKAVVTRAGVPMGGVRLPHRPLSAQETEQFLAEFDEAMAEN